MADGMHKLPASKAHLQGLRINDLVAKVAKVTLKDTTRVLMALDVIVDFLELPTDEILGAEFVVTRPIGDEAEKCTLAFMELEEYLQSEGEGDFLDAIRAVD